MNTVRWAIPLLCAAALAGCASRGEVAGLRDEVGRLNAQVQQDHQMIQANQQATAQAQADARAAADRAAQAEQQSSAATERADRMYSRGLRK